MVSHVMEKGGLAVVETEDEDGKMVEEWMEAGAGDR